MERIVRKSVKRYSTVNRHLRIKCYGSVFRVITHDEHRKIKEQHYELFRNKWEHYPISLEENQWVYRIY